jgi:DNA-directed RNA polymerase specialized sigma24 family protein
MSDVLDEALGELVEGMSFDQFARRTWTTWLSIASSTCSMRRQTSDVDDVLQEILLVVWLRAGEWDSTKASLKNWLVWSAKIAAYAEAKKLRRTISTTKKITRVVGEEQSVPPTQEDRVFLKELFRLVDGVDRKRLRLALEQGGIDAAVDKLMRSSQARDRLEMAHDRPNCRRIMRRTMKKILQGVQDGNN